MKKLQILCMAIISLSNYASVIHASDNVDSLNKEYTTLKFKETETVKEIQEYNKKANKERCASYLAAYKEALANLSDTNTSSVEKHVPKTIYLPTVNPLDVFQRPMPSSSSAFGFLENCENHAASQDPNIKLKYGIKYGHDSNDILEVTLTR